MRVWQGTTPDATRCWSSVTRTPPGSSPSHRSAGADTRRSRRRCSRPAAARCRGHGRRNLQPRSPPVGWQAWFPNGRRIVLVQERRRVGSRDWTASDRNGRFDSRLRTCCRRDCGRRPFASLGRPCAFGSGFARHDDSTLACVGGAADPRSRFRRRATGAHAADPLSAEDRGRLELRPCRHLRSVQRT